MIRFLRKILKPYKKLIVALLVLQIISNCLSLYLPAINAKIIDVGVPNQDIHYILVWGGIMIALSLIQIIFSVGANIVGAKAALLGGRDLREKMYTKILSLSEREVAMFGASTLVTRSTNDVQQVLQFITSLFTVIISAPIMFVGGILMAATLDLSLSTIIFIMLPVFTVISVVFVKKIIPSYRIKQEKIDEVNAILRDQISGVRVVKAFVKEEYEKEKMDNVSQDLSNINLSIGRTTSIMNPLFLFIVNIVVILIAWYGGYRALAGQTQIGTIIAMITYANFILSAVMMASMVFILYPRAEVSVKRIVEVLDTKSSVSESEVAKEDKGFKESINFDNVSFSYAPENNEVEPVLKDINFTAKAGKVTAIIGSTGCGKTTLLNLIERLMDVTKGSVSLDGTNIKDIKIEALRRKIGIVPQKAFLFSGTLKDNLKFANPDATEDEMWEALRVAQAEEFIRENKDGLNAKVSEGGINFSGGQRQRLAIARAVVRKPNIYLFDDSFSALDYKTDKKLRGELKKITKDAIVIMVAQRISTIADADSIIVMNNGCIEDIGTHEELLRRCTTYKEIAASQPMDKEE